MYSGRKWSIFLLRRLDCYWTLGAYRIFSPCCLHPHFLENGKTCCSKNNRKLLCLTYRFTDLLAALSTVSIAAIRSFKTLSSRFPHFVSNIMLPLEVAPQSHLNRHTSGVSSPYTVSGVSHSQSKKLGRWETMRCRGNLKSNNCATSGENAPGGKVREMYRAKIEERIFYNSAKMCFAANCKHGVFC